MPQSFEEFCRMTQADLRRLRDIENSAKQLESQILDAIEQRLIEIVTRLEGGTLPDHETLRLHASRLINEHTKEETYHWKGTPILRVSYNQNCPPARWSTDYVTLTVLV